MKSVKSGPVWLKPSHGGYREKLTVNHAETDEAERKLPAWVHAKKQQDYSWANLNSPPTLKKANKEQKDSLVTRSILAS